MKVHTSPDFHSCRDTKSAFLRRINPRLSGIYDTAQVADESHGRAIKKIPIDNHKLAVIMNERSFRINVMQARKDTKELIDRAALKLFVEQGVAETSIKDIAREAGISQGAMYNHYASKDELAWLLFSDNFTEIGTDLRQIAREERDIRSKFQSITAYIFDRYDRDPLLISYCFLARHMHLTQMRTRLGNPYLVIRTAIEGEIRRKNIPSQHLDVAAALVTGAIIQIIDIHILGSLRGPLAPRANAVADACVAILKG